MILIQAKRLAVFLVQKEIKIVKEVLLAQFLNMVCRNLNVEIVTPGGVALIVRIQDISLF